ncbi:glycosyltransferase [Micromonospora sp. NPDC049101]|uniref:glycosyltransferase family 2 protein n=1 Tax=unclassified Micromonospora TaxID=2617518 RepID=UPI0033FC8872
MSHSNPLVSVIVPHHNRRDALALCLRALAAQTYAPIEIIVVDDCSTDDSVAVAESSGATVLRTRTNSGQSAARNLGAGHAGGEILFFLDSDIALDPDSIGNAVAMLRDDPNLGAVCGILHPRSLIADSLAARYRALQMYHWWMPTGGPTRELHAALLAVPARVFAEIGGFNPYLRDTEAADYRARLVQRYDVALTDRIRGCHDHDPTLRMVLHKVFRRAVASALEWRRGELPGDSRSRAVAGVLVVLATLALPLPLLVGAAGAAVTPLLLAAAIGLDGTTYRQVFASEGLLFGGYFFAVHLLVTLVGTVGMGVGVLQRILLRRTTSAVRHSVPVR